MVHAPDEIVGSKNLGSPTVVIVVLGRTDLQMEEAEFGAGRDGVGIYAARRLLLVVMLAVITKKAHSFWHVRSIARIQLGTTSSVGLGVASAGVVAAPPPRS